MNAGDDVIFEGKMYRILWVYNDGNCELLPKSGFQVKLVHQSKIRLIEEPKIS